MADGFLKITPDLNRVRLLTHSNMLAVMSEIIRRSSSGACRCFYAEIGRATGIRSNDAAKAVRNMASWGLVTIEQDGPSKPVTIHITPKGRAFRAEVLALFFPEAAHP